MHGPSQWWIFDPVMDAKSTMVAINQINTNCTTLATAIQCVNRLGWRPNLVGKSPLKTFAEPFAIFFRKGLGTISAWHGRQAWEWRQAGTICGFDTWGTGWSMFYINLLYNGAWWFIIRNYSRLITVFCLDHAVTWVVNAMDFAWTSCPKRSYM